MVVELTLPYPPSVNSYWRHVVVGGAARVLISKEGREYRERVGEVLLLRGRSGLPLLGNVAVDILLHPPDRRRRDIDNTLKALLDAMTHAGVMEDDSQIHHLRIRRGTTKSGGEVVVELVAHDDLQEAR